MATLTQQQKIKIREFIDEKWGEYIMRGAKLDRYHDIEMWLRGWDAPKKRTCKCEYRSLRKTVSSLINQYHSVIYTDGDSEI
jgi:hypothetical protein